MRGTVGELLVSWAFLRHSYFLVESDEAVPESGLALPEADMPRRGGWHPHDGDATSRGSGSDIAFGPCSERGKAVPRVRDSVPCGQAE